MLKTSVVIKEIIQEINDDYYNQNSKYIGFSFIDTIHNGIYKNTNDLNVKFVKIIWKPKQVK